MGKFKDWFDNKLRVGMMPDVNMYSQLQKSGVKTIINVSDEWNIQMSLCAEAEGIRYFWFPMNEFSNNYDIGINSIYGALQILRNCEKSNEKVYIHCHAGSNRSPTVRNCYYYMRTKFHYKDTPVVLDSDIAKMFGNPDIHQLSEFSNNRLIENIRMGYLPAKHKMESFLKQCDIAFERYYQDFTTPSLETIRKKANI